MPQNGPKHRRRGPTETAPWFVQAGAYKSLDHAKTVADRLDKHGWSARAVQQRDGWVIVEVSGFRTRQTADTAAQKLAAKEQVPTLVKRLKLPAEKKPVSKKARP